MPSHALRNVSTTKRDHKFVGMGETNSPRERGWTSGVSFEIEAIRDIIDEAEFGLNDMSLLSR